MTDITIKGVLRYFGIVAGAGAILGVCYRVGDYVAIKLVQKIEEHEERKAHERELKKEYINVKRNES